MTFFNIFSNKKLKEKQQTTIIVDNREKNSLVISELIKLGNKVKLEQLQIADYLIGDIAIERKTLLDLKNSIIDKRIFSQLKNLKQYSKNLLILEQNNQQDNINENVVRGFLLSTILKFKVPIIYSNNEIDTAKYLSILANKKSSKKEISIRPNKVAISDKEKIQFILEGLPNIGSIKAKALIKEFKTIKSIVNASKEELERVLGKNAEGVYCLFNQEFQP